MRLTDGIAERRTAEPIGRRRLRAARRDLCAKAVTVAEDTFPATHPPFLSIVIEAPTPLKTCPPSGGPGPGLHICGVIVTVTTADGSVDVGLVPSDDSWVWAAMMS